MKHLILLSIVVALLLSGCGSGPDKSEYPYQIISMRSGASLYIYCKDFNVSTRTGYNCIESAFGVMTAYPEFHLGANDSWFKR